jgi:hypothetical protein
MAKMNNLQIQELLRRSEVLEDRSKLKVFIQIIFVFSSASRGSLTHQEQPMQMQM